MDFSSITGILYILLLVIIVFFTSFLMEIYKKVIRKDKHKNWECWIVGLVLSIGCVFLLKESNAMYCLFSETLKAKVWLDYVIYIIVFYLFQMNADMLIIKKLMKSMLTTLLKKSNLSDEQIDLIFKSIEKKENC